MTERTQFTLVVVTSRDGFMARFAGDPPSDWQSPEESEWFRDRVEKADWCVLGRTTHVAAFRPQRRRVVLSTNVIQPEWRSPTQLWFNPADHSPDDLPPLVSHVHPMRDALILGGASVHDWFLEHRRIDHVILSIEPVEFGSGVTVFTGTRAADPCDIFLSRGFVATGERLLNSGGSRQVTFLPATPA